MRCARVVIPQKVFTRPHELFGIVREYPFRLLARRKKPLQTSRCFRCILCFHRIALSPTRVIILHDKSVSVPTSRLISHVLNFVICRDEISKFWEPSDIIHALLWLSRTSGTGGLDPFAYIAMSEHIVTSFRVGTNDAFTILGFARQSLPLSASGSIEEAFAPFECASAPCVELPPAGLHGVSASTSSPSVKGFSNFHTVSSVSLSSGQEVALGW